MNTSDNEAKVELYRTLLYLRDLDNVLEELEPEVQAAGGSVGGTTEWHAKIVRWLKKNKFILIIIANMGCLPMVPSFLGPYITKVLA